MGSDGCGRAAAKHHTRHSHRAGRSLRVTSDVLSTFSGMTSPPQAGIHPSRPTLVWHTVIFHTLVSQTPAVHTLTWQRNLAGVNEQRMCHTARCIHDSSKAPSGSGSLLRMGTKIARSGQLLWKDDAPKFASRQAAFWAYG